MSPQHSLSTKRHMLKGLNLWHAVQDLDVFLAGDDVPKKKPDPTIYRIAAERLGVSPEECIVIEDSVIGAQVQCCRMRSPR